MPNFRNLKIHTKYQARKYGEEKIPEIRLEGKWLEALGFKQGQTVKIKQQKNKLTITVVNEQKPVSLAAGRRALWPVRHAQTRLPVGKQPICFSVGIAAYLFGFTKCPPRPNKCAAIAIANMCRVPAQKKRRKKLKLSWEKFV